MPPQEVGHVKEGRSPRGAAVDHVEYCRQKAVQIDDGLCEAIKLECLIAAVPPAVRGAHRQSHGPTLFDANLNTVHLRGEGAGHDSSSLVFLEMNVERWTVLIRWERALQFQAHLAVQRHTTQLQALACMTVDQCQPAVPCFDWLLWSHFLLASVHKQPATLDTMSSSTTVQHRRQLDTMSSSGSRHRVLEAALRLIRKRGDAKVTMAQIAKAARLSRQAVYLHFADRADLMVALARHVNESLGLPAEIQRMMNTQTGMGMIEAFVSMQARGNPAVWAVARAIDAVRRTDAAAARAWQSRLKSRLEGCRAIVSRLKAEGSLRPELDPSIAADLLWTMTSLRMWEDLVLEREWSPEQYQVYVTNVLIGALTSSRSE